MPRFNFNKFSISSSLQTMQFPHLQLVIFFLLLATTTIFAAAAGELTPADELRSLLEFKKGINEDPLRKIFDSWNTPTSDPEASICSKFYGISCNENGFVSAVNLDHLDLSGDLKFVTLYNLKFLKNLSLSGNRFTGRIVPVFGSMYSLQYLDLSANQFYGPIPEKINDLYGLSYLNLSSNNFSGGFPNGIQNLQQLAVLDLHSNSLWGDLSVLFSQLRNVQYVDLSDNAFYGSLSTNNNNVVPSVVNTVQYVNLSQNRLGGGFFSEEILVLFRNLHVLDLSDNELNGKLPSFGSIPNLEVLRLSNTQLFGPIPEELLESFIPLKELDLSRNGFSGSIPRINSTSLTTLNLSSNELSGSLPLALGNCQIVDLSNNILSDDISVIQKWESPLQVLDLSSNKLTGNLPSLTSHFKGLTVLSVGNNSLKGTVPPILMSSPSLTLLDLSMNELDGPIPPGLFTSMALTNLNLSKNKFTGPIPLQGSQEKSLIELSPYPPMERLDLSYNTLAGVLSSDIGNFRRLKLLNLGNDGLSGELPNELSKLTQLEVLDLSNNHFKGKIPENLSPVLKFLNMSGNSLSGKIPKNLKNFSDASFFPGNPTLSSTGHHPSADAGLPPQSEIERKNHKSKSSIKIAIIVASVVAALMIAFVLLAYYRAQIGDFRVKTTFGGQTSLTPRDIKHGISNRPTTSLSFSNAHLLTSNSRSLSGQSELGGEAVEPPSMPPAYAASSISAIPNLIDTDPAPSGRKSSPGSPIASSPRFVETIEQAVTLDVYSPDRFAGQLFFFDPRPQLSFTAEDLSRAPAEILGRSSHGTLYKATLGGGHMLTVKWLRVGLTKDKKEFAKEIKKIGTMIHPNVVRLVAYYWGPREQERLTLANYIEGDSLALHLYETTPRRYSLLSFNQRLKVAVDVARGLSYLHGRGMPHGNLKPTNIILEGPQYNAQLTDFGLHRLMTPAGIAEQILNLGALGYRAPELASGPRPVPSFKADVYAFGVILMELLTRRSAGDIISGQSGAVDLTDWVRLCDQEGRGMDCIDRDIAGGEQHSKAMDDLLEVSLRCILPSTERPTIRQILEDLCAISV